MKTYTNFFLILLRLYVIMFFPLTSIAEENDSFTNDDVEMPLVRFGFEMKALTDVDIRDAKTAVEFWVREVAEDSGLRAETYIYEDLNSLVKELQRGKIDVANTTPLDYLRITQMLELEISFGILKRGKKTRKFILLVRSDSSFNRVEDLRGRRLVLKKGDDIGHLYLNTLLLRNKQEEANKFFWSIHKKKKFSQTILNVFFGQADACITTDVVFKTMVDLNPQIGKRLKVISSSQEIIYGLNFFRKDFDDKIKEKIKRKSLGLKETVHGKQVLLLFKADAVIILKESDLETLKALLNEYEELKSKKKHRVL